MSKKYTREDIAAKYGEDFLNALGNKHDREISERWGMPRGTIYSIRRLLGIQSFSKNDAEAAAVDRVVQRYGQDIIFQFGTMSDRELGKLYGISGSAVTRMRQKLNYQSMVEGHPEKSRRHNERVVVFMPKGLFGHSQNESVELFLEAWEKAKDSKRPTDR